MGFGNFSHFVDLCKAEDVPVDRLVALDWGSAETKPWVIIDWNNVTMKLISETGGDMVALNVRCLAIFSALFSCGARLCILKDGDHDLDRLIVKFDRAITNLEENLDSAGPRATKPLESSRMAIALASQVAMAVLREQHPSMSADASQVSPDVTCIFQQVHGEADGAIRLFAAQRLAEGNEVFILSDDHSLLLGLPERNLHFMRPSTLFINPDDGAKLYGSAVHLHEYLVALTRRCNRVCDAPLNKKLFNHLPVTPAMLPYISALFGGDMRRFRGRCYDDPIRLTWFLDHYFNVHDQHRGLTVVAAAILVRAWFQPEKAIAEGFLPCIVEVVKAAHRAVGGHQIPSIFGLYTPNTVSKAVRDAGSSMLFIFEKSVSKDRVQGPIKKDGAVMVSYRHQRRFAARVQHINKDGSVGVLYSDPKEASDYVPCALANTDVQKAMAWQVDRAVREVAPAAAAAPGAPAYFMLWGSWSRYEPKDVCTEVQLSPLESLVQQLHYLRSLSPEARRLLADPAELQAVLTARDSKLLHAGDAPGATVAVHMMFEALHEHLVERGLVERKSSLAVKIARTKAPVTPVQLTYQLHDTHVKEPETYPSLAAQGAFASKYGGEALEWQVRAPGELWAGERGLCLPSPLYAAVAGCAGGLLLNLDERARYAERFLQDLSRGADGLAQDLAAADLAAPCTQALMDALLPVSAPDGADTARTAAMAARESITALLVALPVSEQARAFLFETLVAAEAADLSFGALFCAFKLELLPPSMAIPAICAMLLSPIFAAQSFDRIRDGTLCVTTTQFEFEKKLRELHRGAALNAGTKQTDRAASLLELALCPLLRAAFGQNELRHARFFQLTGVQAVLGAVGTAVPGAPAKAEVRAVMEALGLSAEQQAAVETTVGAVFGAFRELMKA